MFSSMICTSQFGGQSAASVARPSGGLTARLPERISRSAQRKLQKLSLKRGLTSSSRTFTSYCGAPCKALAGEVCSARAAASETPAGSKWSICVNPLLARPSGGSAFGRVYVKPGSRTLIKVNDGAPWWPERSCISPMGGVEGGLADMRGRPWHAILAFTYNMQFTFY